MLLELRAELRRESTLELRSGDSNSRFDQRCKHLFTVGNWENKVEAKLLTGGASKWSSSGRPTARNTGALIASYRSWCWQWHALQWSGILVTYYTESTGLKSQLILCIETMIPHARSD
jgi:hypothetical protein